MIHSPILSDGEVKEIIILENRRTSCVMTERVGDLSMKLMKVDNFRNHFHGQAISFIYKHNSTFEVFTDSPAHCWS